MSAPIEELQNAFNNGLTFEAYLDSMSTLQNQMRRQYQALLLNEQSLLELNGLLATFGPVNVLIITEDFCADSALNTPVVAHLAEAMPNLNLRIVRREAYRALADQYPAASGHNHIPTVIFFKPDGPELGVWHERPAKALRFLEQYQQKHPQPEKHLPSGELNPDYRNWVKTRLQVQQAQYQADFAAETVREFTALLKESVAAQTV